MSVPVYLSHIFEPTCACCTVGSYASLSVCLSVCHVTIPLDNNSYISKYYSCDSETLPQHKAFIMFIDASMKNTNYTLKNLFLVILCQFGVCHWQTRIVFQNPWCPLKAGITNQTLVVPLIECPVDT